MQFIAQYITRHLQYNTYSSPIWIYMQLSIRTHKTHDTSAGACHDQGNQFLNGGSLAESKYNSHASITTEQYSTI